MFGVELNLADVVRRRASFFLLSYQKYHPEMVLSICICLISLPTERGKPTLIQKYLCCSLAHNRNHPRFVRGGRHFPRAQHQRQLDDGPDDLRHVPALRPDRRRKVLRPAHRQRGARRRAAGHTLRRGRRRLGIDINHSKN